MPLYFYNYRTRTNKKSKNQTGFSSWEIFIPIPGKKQAEN